MMVFVYLAAALVLLAMALLPLAHVAYTRWVRRRFPQGGTSFVHDGTRLHYLSRGQGPAVVLVHGANGTLSDFPPELIDELASDHTVLALDRPGHGWSDSHTGPLGMHENAAAVLALLRAQGARGATLVGHSYGAAVALRAALEAPEWVSHVVAVAPCTAIDRRNARYANAPFVGDRLGLALFHFAALPLLPFGLPLRAQAWHPERAPRGWGASRAFAYVPSQMHASARNFRALRAEVAWLEEHLPRLTARLTVLAGASDRVTPPGRHVEWLRTAVPGARIEVMPGVGHWLPRLRPEAVAAAVRANGSS
jgi:pimeloyl-ACP methyl ester carboxylesterase